MNESYRIITQLFKCSLLLFWFILTALISPVHCMNQVLLKIFLAIDAKCLLVVGISEYVLDLLFTEHVTR